MAFRDSAGNGFTNRQQMVQSEQRLKAKAPATKAPHAPESEEQFEQQGAEGVPNDAAQLAAEHGPAVQIDIQHDHEGGRHAVHAMHADGHEHDSEHGSAHEAHKFAAEVAGVGGEPDGDEN